MNDLVSIITPSYNSSPFIAETVASVLSQTYPIWELLVVDACSTDDTCEIVWQCAKKDERIKLIELGHNRGPAVSRNRGVERATGRYIAFLDSDDLWLPEKLEEQLAFMKGKNAVLSYTGYRKIDEKGRPMGNIIGIPEQVVYKDLLRSNAIPNLTAVYDSGALGKVLSPLVVKHEDYALWLTILKKGHCAYGLNKCLALYRVRYGSRSGNKLSSALATWAIYRHFEKLPLHTSVFCFLQYAYQGYKKRRT